LIDFDCWLRSYPILRPLGCATARLERSTVDASAIMAQLPSESSARTSLCHACTSTNSRPCRHVPGSASKNFLGKANSFLPEFFNGVNARSSWNTPLCINSKKWRVVRSRPFYLTVPAYGPHLAHPSFLAPRTVPRRMRFGVTTIISVFLS
jgi:hypothetical protein